MTAEIAAVVLAAGQGTRFGAGVGASKVDARLGGRALVAHAVAAALASRASPVILVTGHAADRVVAALDGAAPDAIVHNPAYADGMASSLRAGLAAVPRHCDGALVLLADMPLVAAATLDALIECFAADRAEAVAPRCDGRRGNPVLLGRALFAEAAKLGGDEGARRLLRGPDVRVLDCDVDDPGILLDVDTPDVLAALRGRS